jgi:hypothetical protein
MGFKLGQARAGRYHSVWNRCLTTGRGYSQFCSARAVVAGPERVLTIL